MKNLCLERLPGKLQHHAKRSSCIGPWKAGLTPGDIRMTLQVIFWFQTTAFLSLELPEWESHFTDFRCMLHHRGNPLLWRHVQLQPDTENIFCATSAILPAQKKNSDFSGLRKPASSLSHVDGSRERCLCSLRTLPFPEIPEKTDPLISAEGCVQITGLTTES